MDRIGFYIEQEFTINDLTDHQPLTLIRITAAANHRINILGMDIGFSGADPATVPYPFKWQVQSTDGTAAVTDPVPQKRDRGFDESILGTFETFADSTATVEPVTKTDLIALSLHRQGAITWAPPGGPIVVKGSEAVGLEWNGPDPGAGTTILCSLTVYCEQ